MYVLLLLLCGNFEGEHEKYGRQRVLCIVFRLHPFVDVNKEELPDSFPEYRAFVVDWAAEIALGGAHDAPYHHHLHLGSDISRMDSMSMIRFWQAVLFSN